ncbi:MAG: hypothetical protein HYY14_06615 [Candidatus Omnitrophica bacterium]|nr:hypothetical protein [Candidatus Omnitrophota bacterium]
MTSKSEARWDLILCAVLFLGIFLPHVPLAQSELLSPDASGYLDMGRNLFSGKGAVITYNLYQYWPGTEQPSLPFMQPVYPVLAGILWALSGLKGVIGLNIALLAANCVLLNKILGIYLDRWASFMVALFMGYTPILIFSAIWPWTEHLHLASILIAVWLYLKERHPFWVGVVLGFSALIRAAGFYNILAFGLALVLIHGMTRKAFGLYARVASGVLAILLPYEILCFLKWGTWYPEYLAAAKTYRLSELVQGAHYESALPVLRLPTVPPDRAADWTNLARHLAGFVREFGSLMFVFILVPAYLVFDYFKTRSRLCLIFALQGGCTLFFYALSHQWLPEIETGRYSLIPYMMLGAAGFWALREGALVLGKKWAGLKRPITLHLVLIPFLVFQFLDYLPFRHAWGEVYPAQVRAYRISRDEVYSWIREHAPLDALVASQFLADPCLFERPFVSLPSGAALTPENLVRFLDIYRPGYVLVGNVDISNFLKTLGFQEVMSAHPLVLLHRI